MSRVSARIFLHFRDHFLTHPPGWHPRKKCVFGKIGFRSFRCRKNFSGFSGKSVLTGAHEKAWLAWRAGRAWRAWPAGRAGLTGPARRTRSARFTVLARPTSLSRRSSFSAGLSPYTQDFSFFCAFDRKKCALEPLHKLRTSLAHLQNLQTPP